MLSLLIICFIAGGLGAILQGMVGIGTGIVIIPLLTFLLPYYGIEKGIAIHIALATSMAAIVINSISALISHHRYGNIQWGLFKKIVLFCMLGSFLGALTASYISGRYLEIIFGAFMVLLAIYMLLKKAVTDTIESSPNLPLKLTAPGGLSIGFVASIIGTGGGVLMIPFLNALKVKMRYAVGTSTLISLPIAFIGTFTYIFAGLSQNSSSDVTLGYLHWPAFLAISASGVLCASLGAKFTTILPTKTLQQVFAVCMVLVGITMIL
jgi:uncharacterized membrane protein YfcA